MWGGSCWTTPSTRAASGRWSSTHAQRHQPQILAEGHPRAKRIVYVSCNPSTQARDLVALREAGYVLKAFKPDHPHTAHLEAVSLLALMRQPSRAEGKPELGTP